MKNAPAIFYAIFLAAQVVWPQKPLPWPTPIVDTISAGDSILIAGKAPVDTVAHPEYSQLITWTLSPAGTRSSLTTQHGTGNVFHAVDAYKQYHIVLTFVDPATPYLLFLDTVAVYVKPGPPDHLLIEASADSTKSLNADNRLGTLKFPGPVWKDSVYAVLRDKYGNFVSHALLAAWTSRDTGIVTALPARMSLGEGVITRTIPNDTFTCVAAIQGIWKDSLQVVLINPTYVQIQIVVRGSVNIDTLSIRTDQDTTLSARGLRSDGSGIWDPINVMWGNSAGMTFNNSAPASSNSWTFRPQTSVTGKIFIVWGTGAHQLTDTIVVILPYPDMPIHMTLYPAPGPPNTTTNVPYRDPKNPYAPSVTITAGTTLPLVAKIFDLAGQWLSSYERADVPISWKIVELTGATGSGVLDKVSGYQVNFTGLKAFQTVRVTAILSMGGVYISDSITISILRIPAFKLVIEPDTAGMKTLYLNDPTAQHRAGQITIGATETSRSVYAVLRDIYGNFIRFSDSTIWTSRDTSVVKVTGGNASYGEALLTRSASMGQTYVIAQDKSNPAVSDSVLVVLATCCSRVSISPSPHSAQELNVEIPGAGRRVIALPRDIGNARLSFALYSLSGRVVFKTDVVDAGKPICVNYSVQPGIYIVNIRTTERQLVKSRFVFIK